MVQNVVEEVKENIYSGKPIEETQMEENVSEDEPEENSEDAEEEQKEENVPESR